jgi:hypothetical protein
LRATLVLLIGVVLVWAAPLLGLALAGIPVTPYLQFPPLTEAVAHAPFSWDVFVALSLLVAAVALGVCSAVRINVRPARPPSGRLPRWGAFGFLLIACGWTFAWSEGLVPPEWRRHTFAVLWLGYILAMNGLVRRRTGKCLLTHHTRWFLLLFPLSAGFWWLFEHLNQFIDNWYYSGVHASRRWDYFLQATLPFATVLPAVASTWAWLGSYPHLEFARLPAVGGHPALTWLALVVGMLGLAGIGVWPETLYPGLWVAPLFIVCALQQLLVGETLLAPLRQGDWRPLVQPALAGLMCGVLWELWNYGSAAKWHYSIPYVQRFHLFEMPLLGYAGYLPFGVVCALVLDLALRLVERRSLYLSRNVVCREHATGACSQ